MKILFWNIRGLGAEGRRKQLSEIRQIHRVDVICLQETIKREFSVGELATLSEGFRYEWVWTAAQGHSGGTLIGVKTDDITVIGKECGEFYSSMKIRSRKDEFRWEVVNVYGPVQVERKHQFLEELSHEIADMEDPFILGGDFNLIRFP
jgi:exonuclease III